MPRTSRKKSNSRIYHIIVRGINKQDIFFDKQDYNKFIKEIKNTKEKYQYGIYAYCLMPNHVHIEMRDNEGCIEKIMKSLMVAYASYYNKKYDRVGHVFQDRYLSKEVENDEYVLDLQRYIHQNPQKAGIFKTEEYKWSSYKDYITKSGITDIQYVMKLLDMEVEKFKKYNEDYKYKARTVYEFEITRKLTDEQAKAIIEETLQINNLQEIQKYERRKRNKILAKLKDLEKIIYISQISRVTGINRKMIERILNKMC